MTLFWKCATGYSSYCHEYLDCTQFALQKEWTGLKMHSYNQSGLVKKKIILENPKFTNSLPPPLPNSTTFKTDLPFKKCHFVPYLDTYPANEMTTVYRSWFWFQMVSVVWAWLILPWQCLCSVKWRTTVAGMYWTAVTHSSLAVATTKYEIRGYICYINFPSEIHLIFEMWNFIPCKKFITIADNKTFLLK